MHELEQLLSYCAGVRVCPMPLPWHQLWDMLPNKKCDGSGWDPPVPLILAAWWDTSDDAKRERFELHVRWAAAHIVAGDDQIINPDLERWSYTRARSHTTEIKGASHFVYESHAKEVAAVIADAARNENSLPP